MKSLERNKSAEIGEGEKNCDSCGELLREEQRKGKENKKNRKRRKGK